MGFLTRHRENPAEQARRTMATLAALTAMLLTEDDAGEQLLAAEIDTADTGLFGQAALTMLQTFAAGNAAALDDDGVFGALDAHLRTATQAMMRGNASAAFGLIRGRLDASAAAAQIAAALLLLTGDDWDAAVSEARRWCQAYQLLTA